ncbi:GAF domain-containing protein [Pedobacter sp. AK017]|uniref:GAF domain-containing protein n=1 Tax=Pedobacter sp. AK017 TaxID=2723073 RepID=UPI001612C083|nr:GAF domain-containing protein [Pedobacter sp. AK017]MBB5438711.1 GAF domain-containing protein [Pedobacter sp. AK017]
MRQLEKKLRKSIASDERSRLENLKNYKILYTKSEPVFDQLAAFTAKMLNTPIALINFVDQESSLCSLAIINESGIAFENFEQHPYLMSNALIAGESGLGFYAAVPITTDEGLRVGTVCIVDKKHRKFLPQEQRKMEWVAGMVKKEINRRIAGRIMA